MTFDFFNKRRKEIVRHGQFVDAMDTADRGRWLIAWVQHNRKAADPVWSVMEAAKSMGGKITEAEASAITKEASTTRRYVTADSLAEYLGVTYPQRQLLRLTTIGACDFPKRQRMQQRRHKDRMAKEKKRRALGMRPQSESLSATEPWRKMGMSRRTWYRKNKARTGTDGTTLSAAIFLSSEDKPVPTGVSEEEKRESERGEAPREKQEGDFRLKRADGATLAADRFETLPLELRLLALGLPMPDQKLARAA